MFSIKKRVKMLKVNCFSFFDGCYCFASLLIYPNLYVIYRKIRKISIWFIETVVSVLVYIRYL